MLNLESTDILRVITTAAVTIDVSTDWVDFVVATEAVTPDHTSTAISTATTTTIVAAPAAGTVRNITRVEISNIHASTSQTITVEWYNGSVAFRQKKFTLLAGESATMTEIGSWLVYDIAGGVKSTGTGIVDPTTNGFRLSGVTGTPVMTADSTTLSTVFLCQWKSNRIALYDGFNWQLCTPSSEPSLAVTGRTTDLPFDVFAYSAAGVVTLEFLNWTSASARATGLTRVDGVLTKTGDSTRRYIGSVRARSATTYHWVRAGVDLPAKFDLYNADNRVEVNWSVVSLTNSWTYTLATWRQAQGSANYQLDVMVGLQESDCGATVAVSSRNSTISIPRHVGIGFDSTTVMSGITSGTANTVASIEADQWARFINLPAIGTHKYCWLEISTATGTCTWIGDDGALRLMSGMCGEWTC